MSFWNILQEQPLLVIFSSIDHQLSECVTWDYQFLRGMTAGQAVSRFWSGIFFFFVVVTNRQINLCIKICPPLVGMYCSDCLQQKQANQNLLFGHISRERGPTHPFLCDVKSLFDLFIKPWLNSTLSQKGFIVLIVLNKNSPIRKSIIGAYITREGPLLSVPVLRQSKSSLRKVIFVQWQPHVWI